MSDDGLKEVFLVYAAKPDAAEVGRVMRAFHASVRAAEDPKTYLSYDYTYPRGHTESFPGHVRSGEWANGEEPKLVKAFVRSENRGLDLRAEMVAFDPRSEIVVVRASDAVIADFKQRVGKIGLHAQ